MYGYGFLVHVLPSTSGQVPVLICDIECGQIVDYTHARCLYSIICTMICKDVSMFTA